MGNQGTLDSIHSSSVVDDMDEVKELKRRNRRRKEEMKRQKKNPRPENLTQNFRVVRYSGRCEDGEKTVENLLLGTDDSDYHETKPGVNHDLLLEYDGLDDFFLTNFVILSALEENKNGSPLSKLCVFFSRRIPNVTSYCEDFNDCRDEVSFRERIRKHMTYVDGYFLNIEEPLNQKMIKFDSLKQAKYVHLKFLCGQDLSCRDKSILIQRLGFIGYRHRPVDVSLVYQDINEIPISFGCTRRELFGKINFYNRQHLRPYLLTFPILFLFTSDEKDVQELERIREEKEEFSKAKMVWVYRLDGKTPQSDEDELTKSPKGKKSKKTSSLDMIAKSIEKERISSSISSSVGDEENGFVVIETKSRVMISLRNRQFWYDGSFSDRPKFVRWLGSKIEEISSIDLSKENHHILNDHDLFPEEDEVEDILSMNNQPELKVSLREFLTEQSRKEMLKKKKENEDVPVVFPSTKTKKKTKIKLKNLNHQFETIFYTGQNTIFQSSPKEEGEKGREKSEEGNLEEEEKEGEEGEEELLFYDPIPDENVGRISDLFSNQRSVGHQYSFYELVKVKRNDEMVIRLRGTTTRFFLTNIVIQGGVDLDRILSSDPLKSGYVFICDKLPKISGYSTNFDEKFFHLDDDGLEFAKKCEELGLRGYMFTTSEILFQTMVVVDPPASGKYIHIKFIDKWDFREKLTTSTSSGNNNNIIVKSISMVGHEVFSDDSEPKREMYDIQEDIHNIPSYYLESSSSEFLHLNNNNNHQRNRSRGRNKGIYSTFIRKNLVNTVIHSQRKIEQGDLYFYHPSIPIIISCGDGPSSQSFRNSQDRLTTEEIFQQNSSRNKRRSMFKKKNEDEDDDICFIRAIQQHKDYKDLGILWIYISKNDLKPPLSNIIRPYESLCFLNQNQKTTILSSSETTKSDIKTSSSSYFPFRISKFQGRFPEDFHFFKIWCSEMRSIILQNQKKKKKKKKQKEEEEDDDEDYFIFEISNENDSLRFEEFIKSKQQQQGQTAILCLFLPNWRNRRSGTDKNRRMMFMQYSILLEFFVSMMREKMGRFRPDRKLRFISIEIIINDWSLEHVSKIHQIHELPSLKLYYEGGEKLWGGTESLTRERMEQIVDIFFLYVQKEASGGDEPLFKFSNLNFLYPSLFMPKNLNVHFKVMNFYRREREEPQFSIFKSIFMKKEEEEEEEGEKKEEEEDQEKAEEKEKDLNDDDINDSDSDDEELEMIDLPQEIISGDHNSNLYISSPYQQEEKEKTTIEEEEETDSDSDSDIEEVEESLVLVYDGPFFHYVVSNIIVSGSFGCIQKNRKNMFLISSCEDDEDDYIIDNNNNNNGSPVLSVRKGLIFFTSNPLFEVNKIIMKKIEEEHIDIFSDGDIQQDQKKVYFDEDDNTIGYFFQTTLPTCQCLLTFGGNPIEGQFIHIKCIDGHHRHQHGKNKEAEVYKIGIKHVDIIGFHSNMFQVLAVSEKTKKKKKTRYESLNEVMEYNHYESTTTLLKEQKEEGEETPTPTPTTGGGNIHKKIGFVRRDLKNECVSFHDWDLVKDYFQNPYYTIHHHDEEEEEQKHIKNNFIIIFAKSMGDIEVFKKVGKRASELLGTGFIWFYVLSSDLDEIRVPKGAKGGKKTYVMIQYNSVFRSEFTEDDEDEGGNKKREFNEVNFVGWLVEFRKKNIDGDDVDKE